MEGQSRTGSSISIADMPPEFNAIWPENGQFWPVRRSRLVLGHGDKRLPLVRSGTAKLELKYQPMTRLRDRKARQWDDEVIG